MADGPSQIRMAGELPPLLLGATWDAWARYESAINHVYDDFPLWGICAYDRRVASPHVLADVARTHPRLIRPDGVRESTGVYTDPASYLAECRPTASTTW
ncbi:MEDS domain-containing protein [Micromonospora sp. WMMD980]|uniref:MEDS domain-containing protein n=1 Tax=Micromonospora sp. WMMD980 TaxID=3016088 RepID=UPI002417B0C2|nr:MEDS domain-containing protein [Micromonospora sp. WMMD980]MDG4801889.1 MEDS domain-containing protein [Micromonospora sp. WMMD980]